MKSRFRERSSCHRYAPGVRFVIFGAGAIGGVVGARLAQAGRDVVLIARGAHYDAIREHGLTIEDPVQRAVLSIDVFPSPGAVPWTGEDVVMLTTKSQDSDAALHALQDAAPPATPVFCLQNGVENERLALRRFEQVYGAVVMVPAAHLEPGIVLAYGTVRTGMIDIGRYPTGVDQRCEQVAQALQQARFSSEPSPDVMRLKYSKLVLNLANAINAICKPGPAAEQLGDRAKEEGRAVLTAAGIEFEAADVAGIAARWKRWGVRDIAGQDARRILHMAEPRARRRRDRDRLPQRRDRVARPLARGSDPGQRAAVPARQPCSA